MATSIIISDIFARQAFAAFPGANGKIVFETERDANFNWEVYAMNADGTEQTNLSNNPAFDAEPSWSPDGTKIAFTSSRDGRLQIYVMNADGTGQTNISNTASFDSQPSWSPDGTKIAFMSLRDSDRNCLESQVIYLMNADGTGQTRLTDQCDKASDPRWSPDGTKIAFNRNLDLFVMNADGTGQTILSHDSADASWSPDGTKIAFVRLNYPNDDIYVMNADGTGQTRLTTTSSNDKDPSWSPDGTKIAFASNRDYPYFHQIYVMNADGTGQTRLTNTPAEDDHPDWQPLVTVVDFSLTCSPNSLTMQQGGSATSTCTISSLNGFNSPVLLACSGLPPDTNCSFNPSSVTPPAGESVTSTLTLNADSEASAGTFPFQVVGTSGSLSHNFDMTGNVSIFVIPESPIGVIALIGTSLAALGGFMIWKRRQSISQPHSLDDLGI